jgi:hypothetical protein
MKDKDAKLLEEAYSQIDEARYGRRGGNWHTERMRRARRGIGKVKQREAEERAKQVRFSFDGPDLQGIENIALLAFEDDPNIKVTNKIISTDGKKIGAYGTGLKHEGFSTWEAFIILPKDRPDLHDKLRDVAGEQIKKET